MPPPSTAQNLNQIKVFVILGGEAYLCSREITVYMEKLSHTQNKGAPAENVLPMLGAFSKRKYSMIFKC